MLRPGLHLGLWGDHQRIKGMEGQAFTSPSPAADNDHSGLLGNTSSGNESGSLQDIDSHFIPTYECCVLYFCQKEKKQKELTQRKHDT